MGRQRLFTLLFGALAMFLLMLLRRKTFAQIKLWKILVVSIFLTITGTVGTMLMHFIESGSFRGTSFFGAILFVPFFMLLPGWLLRIPYRILMNLCAPAGCIMFAIMKLDCLESNCCFGKYLPSLGFQFPSQIVEIITSLVIMLILLRMEKKSGGHTPLYAFYLILYGCTRFVLNWFRYGLTPFIWILPEGNFWSIIAVAFGMIWLAIFKKANART